MFSSLPNNLLMNLDPIYHDIETATSDAVAPEIRCNQLQAFS